MPLSPDLQNDVAQARMNALSAEHLHKAKLAPLRTRIQLWDALGIAAPFVLTVPQILTRGSEYEKEVEAIALAVGVILAAVAIFKLAFRWEDRAQAHSKYLSENIVVKNAARNLLTDPDATDESARGFLRLVEQIDKSDAETFADISRLDERMAFRAALREFHPGNHALATCPECKVSAWDVKDRDCHLCGNQPEPRKRRR